MTQLHTTSTAFTSLIAPLVTSFRSSTANEREIGLHVFGIRSTATASPITVPLVLYFHGGLFNKGTVADATSIAQVLAKNAVVVCVAYPLAPECHFPDTLEIALEALQWSYAHAAKFGADAQALLVAGDQAGGNLAAGLTMLVRDRNAFTKLRGQILICPLLDPLQTTVSMVAAYDCPCQQAWRDYLPAVSDKTHPYAAPLHSRRLGGLPSALIITEASDPLRDEAEQYAAKLIAAGTPVQVRRFVSTKSNTDSDAKENRSLVNPQHSCFTSATETARQFVADSV